MLISGSHGNRLALGVIESIHRFDAHQHDHAKQENADKHKGADYAHPYRNREETNAVIVVTEAAKDWENEGLDLHSNSQRRRFTGLAEMPNKILWDNQHV